MSPERSAVSRLRDWEAPGGPWHTKTETLSQSVRALASRCATRAERVSSPFFIPTGPPDRVRLEAWKEMFTSPIGPSFERMRDQRGLSENDLAKSLTPVAPAPRAAAPMWVAILDGMWRHLGERGFAERAEPFAPFYRPLVDFLVRGVRLPAQISCSDLVYSRWVSAIVTRWQNALAATADPAPSGPISATEWLARLEASPALARFFADVVAMMVLNARESLRHLGEDAAGLASCFGVPQPTLCRVVDLEWACGDAHNGGRSVCIFTFEDGTRLVYKPKSSGPALWFRRFESAVRKYLASDCRLSLHQIWDAGDHSWEAYVPEEECRSADEVQRFYKRAGVLLALARFARVHDLHGENIRAHASHPVPVDLEVVCTATPQLVEAGRPWLKDPVEYLIHSPLSLGFLPQLERDATGNLYYDLALPSRHESAARFGICVPTFRGRAATIEDHRQPFIDGYRAGADAFVRTHLEGATSRLFDELADLSLRFVPRSTALYDKVWKGSWRMPTPTVLDRELALEAVAVHTPDDDPGLAQVADEEIWALTHGDIPSFVTKAGSTMIRCAGGRSIVLPRMPATVESGFALGNLDRLVSLDIGLISAAIGMLQLPHGTDGQ